MQLDLAPFDGEPGRSVQPARHETHNRVIMCAARAANAASAASAASSAAALRDRNRSSSSASDNPPYGGVRTGFRLTE